MKHPFASIQYVRNSFSADTIGSWLRLTPEPDLPPPVPPLRTPPAQDQPPPERARNRKQSLFLSQADRSSRPTVNVNVPAMSSSSSPGHFVKHSSKATLLLSGQEQGVSEPVYVTGGTVDGILALSRPTGLLSLSVVVEGTIKIRETGGSGSRDVQILRESLFTWDAERNTTFPSKVSFRYTLPSHYNHPETNERFPIPPSYHAHSYGIPGFEVDVAYAVVVEMSRRRSVPEWWQRSTRMRVPFAYRELTYPARVGPFPATLVLTPTSPQTVFQFTMRSRRQRRDNIEVQLYLPNSQICCLAEPIPFFVTLFAPEDILNGYPTFRPSLESFHPLSTTDLSNSLQTQIMDRIVRYPPPVRLLLQRRTQVDVLAASLPCMQVPETHISASKHIASGAVQTVHRDGNKIVWSGSIMVPDRVKCGGFVAMGLHVTDYLELKITPPDSLRQYYSELIETVPVRLSTEPAKSDHSIAISMLNSGA